MEDGTAIILYLATHKHSFSTDLFSPRHKTSFLSFRLNENVGTIDLFVFTVIFAKTFHELTNNHSTFQKVARGHFCFKKVT